jgi:hypothetical protein
MPSGNLTIFNVANWKILELKNGASLSGKSGKFTNIYDFKKNDLYTVNK